MSYLEGVITGMIYSQQIQLEIFLNSQEARHYTPPNIWTLLGILYTYHTQWTQTDGNLLELSGNMDSFYDSVIYEANISQLEHRLREGLSTFSKIAIMYDDLVSRNVFVRPSNNHHWNSINRIYRSYSQILNLVLNSLPDTSSISDPDEPISDGYISEIDD